MRLVDDGEVPVLLCRSEGLAPPLRALRKSRLTTITVVLDPTGSGSAMASNMAESSCDEVELEPLSQLPLPTAAAGLPG